MKHDDDDDDDEEVLLDRISGLPELIIHHIMSYLPTKDVARIPTLSKGFNSLRRCFPIIVFDQTYFGERSGESSPDRPDDIDGFLDYAAGSIQRLQLDTDLERFRLKFQQWDMNYSNFTRVVSLIHFALENRVKELDLDIRLWRHFELMDSFSSKSVSSLKLYNIEFDLNRLFSACPSIKSLDLSNCIVSVGHPFNTSCCQLLRMLSFRDVDITEKWVELNIPSFGNLESLLINDCRKLKNIRVSNNKLERIDVVSRNRKGTKLESLEVIAPNLHCLSLTATACITDKWLKDQIFKSSYIDTLKLQDCRHLKRIEIRNDRLQSLELLKCPSLVEVFIDTPKLHTFSYCGKVTTFTMMNTPSLRNCKLSFNPISAKYLNLDEWYLLRDALLFFGTCKALTLQCKSEQDLIFPEVLKYNRFSPLFNVKHLEIISPWLTFTDRLVENLVWLAPCLETIRVIPKSKKKVTNKMRYEKEVAKDMNLICCRDRKRVEKQNLISPASERTLQIFWPSA